MTSSDTILPTALLHDAPFTSQSPRGQWSDARFQDGCEEASLLILQQWLTRKRGYKRHLITTSRLESGHDLLDPEAVENSILQMAEIQGNLFGTYHDTSPEDTVKLAQVFFGTDDLIAVRDIRIRDIHQALQSGPVIVPLDGRKLKNPYFSGEGPARHMLVILGYDEVKKVFITHDPGTKRGAQYVYPEDRLFDAIIDYPTGHHDPVLSDKKVMIRLR
jgi:hypothetical protein